MDEFRNAINAKHVSTDGEIFLKKGCIIRDGINFDLEPLRAIISAWMDSDYKGLVKTYQYGQIRVKMRTGHLSVGANAEP